jgi:hypothetical protein
MLLPRVRMLLHTLQVQQEPAMTSVPMRTRPIPCSSEPLPVIGCGTYVGFDRAPGSAEFAQLPRVLAALFAAEGSVIDSSPMYGKAEAAVGQVLDETGHARRGLPRDQVWTRGRDAGIRQMETRSACCAPTSIDLLQVHNLVDWRIHLARCANGKRRTRALRRHLALHGVRVRRVEEVLRSEPLDFLQINYSVEESESAQRLLPAGRGTRRRRAGQPALRRRALLRRLHAKRCRLGDGDRLHELAAGVAEIRAEPSRGHLRDSRQRFPGAHGAERAGRLRCDSGRAFWVRQDGLCRRVGWR